MSGLKLTTARLNPKQYFTGLIVVVVGISQQLGAVESNLCRDDDAWEADNVIFVIFAVPLEQAKRFCSTFKSSDFTERQADGLVVDYVQKGSIVRSTESCSAASIVNAEEISDELAMEEVRISLRELAMLSAQSCISVGRYVEPSIKVSWNARQLSREVIYDG